MLQHAELLGLQQKIHDLFIGEMVTRALVTNVSRHSFNGPQGSYPPSANPKAYHNTEHTFSGLQDIPRAAETMDLNRRNTDLAILFFAYHDIVFDPSAPPKANEEASAAELFQDMHMHRQFKLRERKMGWTSIMGTFTEVINTPNGYKLIQHTTLQDYKSKAEQDISHVDAASDLGKLHSPQGPYFAHKLLQEQTNLDPQQPLDVKKFTGFCSMQLDLLNGGYTYPNPTLQKLFTTHTAYVQGHTTGLMTEVEAGNITTLGQVLQRDLAFARQHS